MLELVVLLGVWAPAGGAPQEFLDRFEKREQLWRTAEVRSTWVDFVEGQPERRDQQTIFLDQLGRRRLQMQSEQAQGDGTWIRHEQVPYEWDIVFDGELTASMTFDPRTDRFGNDLKVGGGGGGYRSAQIWDGEWDIIRSQRNPVTYGVGVFVERLRESIQNQQRIDIQSETEEHVTIQIPTSRPGEFERCEVDKSRDWVPVATAVVDEHRKAKSRTRFDYKQTESGIWYVTRITYRYFGDRSEDETPLRETECDVTACKINDPEFDMDVFRIELAPDTAVSDLRLKVQYRVGTELAFAEQFAALAEAARAAQAAEDAGYINRPEPPREPRRGTVILVIVALIVAFLVWLVYRRRTTT